AQWEMFKAYPMGCGHRCTATLSPQYMDDQYLTGPPGNRGRSSHNTFMSTLVEQGIPGAFLYVMMALWTGLKILSVWKTSRNAKDSIPMIFPAVAAVLTITIVADLFVDYLKLEVRIWFIALLLILARKLETAKAPGARQRRT